MPIVSYTPDPHKPVRLSEETKRRLDAMTDEELTANALSDPDNPPLTEHELDQMVTSRAVRMARHAAGLSEEAFAREYLIAPERLNDLENGRVIADAATLYFLRRISDDPQGVSASLAAPVFQRRAG